MPVRAQILLLFKLIRVDYAKMPQVSFCRFISNRRLLGRFRSAGFAITRSKYGGVTGALILLLP